MAKRTMSSSIPQEIDIEDAFKLGQAFFDEALAYTRFRRHMGVSQALRDTWIRYRDDHTKLRRQMYSKYRLLSPRR